MNIVIGARGKPKKFNVPPGGQDESKTTTRRGNLCVALAPRPRKHSRIVRRYAIPASVRAAIKYGPPRSPKLREQIVSATKSVAPSAYTPHSEVTFTALPCPCERWSVSESSTENLPLQAPTLSATQPCVALWSEPDATPLPAESDRPRHRYRKKDLLYLRIAPEPVRAIEVSPARCWFPFRRWRKALDEKPLPQRDSSPHRTLVPRPHHARSAFQMRLREQSAANVDCRC